MASKSETTQGKHTSAKAVNVYVALLRGINVGGKNKLSMKDLVSMFTDAGCKNVRTYIQSGNVVFGAKQALAARIPALITGSIADSLRLKVPIVVRTAEELRETIRHNPFLRTGIDTKRLHVAFLADKPGAKKVAALQPDRSPPDEFLVRGSEIYLHCPNGLARTKLTNAYFDSKLATTTTVRSWATVLKLHDLTGRA